MSINNLIHLLLNIRPRVRRLLPRKFHHSAGHMSRWLVRTIERLASQTPPALPLPVASSHNLRSDDQRPIVLVNTSLTAGGAERQVINLLRGLAARGRRATLVTLHVDQRADLHFFTDELRASNLDLRYAISVEIASDYLTDAIGASALNAFRESLAWSPPDVRDDIVRLTAELHRLRPAVVHGWQDATGICAAFAALAVGTKRIIIGGRNLHPEHFSYARPFIRDAYALLAGRPEVVLSNNSLAGARSYAEWLGIDRTLIRIVRNGIATNDLTRPPEREIEAFRHKLGISKDERVIGGLFRLQAEKRPLLWLEVAALLRKRVPNLRFVIFGDGTMRHQVWKAARRLGLKERLIMPGTIQEVRLALSMLDALLLTSSQEGTPNVVLEATSLGVPVVATDAGGASEAVLEGITGFVIQNGSIVGLANALARAIERVLAGGISIEKLQTHGRNFVDERFGLERMVIETLALYDEGRH